MIPPKSLLGWVCIWAICWIASSVIVHVTAYEIGLFRHHLSRNTLFDDLLDTPRLVASAAIGYASLHWQQKQELQRKQQLPGPIDIA
ncbi:MAG: hypothetical protein ACRYFS_20600 [Janthinobacterium lividum]